MSQDNQITLRGYVTAEPRFRMTTQTATPVAEIRVGSTPRRLNRETGEWQDEATSYYTVKCWRRLAINASSSLHKGDMVVIRGRFYMNEWVDSQQRPRSVLEIEADSVGHDLSYGWSHFLRGTRPQPGNQAALNAGEQARQDLGQSAGDDLGIDPGDGPGIDPGLDGDIEAGLDGEYPAGRGWYAPAEDRPAPDDTHGAPGPEEMSAAAGRPTGAGEPVPVPVPA
jgi:single-strand DNA-binding protein